MILNELFNWLRGDEIFFHFSNQYLSQELLNFEQSLANKKKCTILSEVRYTKLSGLETREGTVLLETHNLYMDYLEFCTKKFAENSKNSLFFITLNYLLAKSQKENNLINKLNELFWFLFQEDKNGTISFYQQNEALFKNNHEIQKHVKIEVYKQNRDAAIQRIESYLVNLREKLSNQQNPLGIIGLCREWISNTEQFAALIGTVILNV